MSDINAGERGRVLSAAAAGDEAGLGAARAWVRARGAFDEGMLQASIEAFGARARPHGAERSALAYLWNTLASFGPEAKARVLEAVFAAIAAHPADQLAWIEAAMDLIHDAFDRTWAGAEVPALPAPASYVGALRALGDRVLALPPREDEAPRANALHAIAGYALGLPLEEEETRTWASWALAALTRFPSWLGLPPSLATLEADEAPSPAEFGAALAASLDRVAEHRGEVEGSPAVKTAWNALEACVALPAAADALALVTWSDARVLALAAAVREDLEWDTEKIPALRKCPALVSALLGMKQPGRGEGADEALGWMRAKLGAKGAKAKGAKVKGAKANKEPRGASALPASLPTDVAGALALCDALGLAQEDLPREKPAKSGAIEKLGAKLGRALPEDLVALLSRANGVGERTIAPVARLSALQSELEEAVEEHLEEADEEGSGRLGHDMRAHLPVTELFAVGHAPSGDVYFVDPRVRTAQGEMPVLALAHGEAMRCRVVAASLGELLARDAVEAWARRERAAEELRRYALGKVKLVAAGGAKPAGKRSGAVGTRSKKR